MLANNLLMTQMTPLHVHKKKKKNQILKMKTLQCTEHGGELYEFSIFS